MARQHFGSASLLCLAAFGAVVGCGPSAPPGRTANEDIRSRASSLLHKNVKEVKFEFQIDEKNDVVRTYVERDPVKINEIIRALMTASRLSEIRIEPGGENMIMDTIEFVVDGKDIGARFSMHRRLLDRRWGPEVKQVHARYRAMAKTEE